MTELQPRNPSEDDRRRQQMIDVITHAVEAEDFEFMNQVASSQDLLRPFELAEYMDFKRQSSKDIGEHRKWTSALHNYLPTLADKDFPEVESDAIKDLIKNLENEVVMATKNEETAKENKDADAEPEAKIEEDDWDSTCFEVDIDKQEYDRIMTLPLFRKAERYASGEVPSYTMDDAKRIIDSYGSSEDAKKLMHSAIDKHVFRTAERYASGKAPTYMAAEAKNYIIKYASTPGRRDAMLRRLGFQ